MSKFSLCGAFLWLSLCIQISAQTYNVHSHNDYNQHIPFWEAFSAGNSSIETDVFLLDGKLIVAHEFSELDDSHTVERLYLEPLKTALEMEKVENPLQLLIDIKTDAIPTLNQIVNSIKKYPELINSEKIKFVISGNQPSPNEFKNYPNFIYFDYQSLEDLTNDQWQKVGLISQDFKKYSVWNGLGGIVKEEKSKVVEVIDKAKSYGKSFRFWGAPDTKTAWAFFAHAGVDFINTDHPFECAAYLQTLDKRTFQTPVFSEVYTPSFQFDEKNGEVKNIILLIGDGNGLSQISSAVLANNGQLTLTQFLTIGLIKTSSSDNFSTDSAAGATALATGQKTYNRAIGVDQNGHPIENICEILQEQGFSTGIITTDEITGATPSAFYAHQKERDLYDEIAKDLLKSKLTFFAAGGKNRFPNMTEFSTVDQLTKIGENKEHRLAYFLADGGVPTYLDGRKDLFPKTVKAGLQYLKNKNKPFFMMIEAAQIDRGGHHNNVGTIVSEGIDFDRSISEAVKFADENPGTLIIVTADHETGGFSLPHGDLATHKIEGDFTTGDHSATIIPIFAYGPKSDEFRGVYENNQVFHKILNVLGIRTK